MEDKKVRKIKKVILQVLGVLTILQIASYIPLWQHYILSNYINRVNSNILNDLMGEVSNGMGYLIIGFLLLVVLVFVIGIIMIMNTASSTKWKKKLSIGYWLTIVFSGIAIIYIFAGIFAYPSHQKSAVAKNGEMLSAILLCVSYIVLLIYLIYKKRSAKEKEFDKANFLLVAAAVLAFLGGGILIPGARPLQTLVFGGAQTMPLIFLIYFEFIYRPVLLTRKKHRRHSKSKKQ